MLPYDVTLGAKEAQRMEALLDELNKIGFEIVYAGNYKYTFKAVPLVLENVKLKDFVDEIVKDEVAYDKQLSQFMHEKICQSACKHAIKAGDTINKEQCAYLIEKVREGTMLCPHGRPVVLEFKKKEIEKMFGRIV